MKIFKEQQRFTQSWLIILILVSMVVPVAVILKDTDKMPLTELIIALAVIIITPCIIFIFQLNTRIDEEGIHYQFFPFHLKYRLIKWNEINKSYVRTYDPIGEYGGWGLKGGFLWKKSKGIAINVKGDIGIQLELTSGKKILIGTQKKAQAESTLENYKHKMS
ncbi:hypothetical protein DFQ05_2064 [Winogradskyella wandonensis]|uniref:PH (Pleckstrin Homology) domain-containing protein n=1 Tax=Winogradskyella wandonensis TaxID=1442586 RepID=A0A4R1KQQ1_9FLAO|nr:hypothetical protein [Winogradskyella wandonensis]TCK66790.1 hypothetical protein DFQ05_2064 [Winogradskyella wandonensis]